MGKASRARQAPHQNSAPATLVGVSPEPLTPLLGYPRALDDVPGSYALRTALAGLEQAEDRLEAAVAASRRSGASWDAISRVTGINRETLRRRYGP